MKKLSYLMLFLLSVIMYGCAETEQPYVGYITVEDPEMLEAEGGSVNLTAITDISSPISCEVDKTGAEWCTVSVNGKEITINTVANPNKDFRTATVKVRCGYREESFTVTQKFDGFKYQYDWSDWTATGSDVQEGDGGGYPSLFSETRTTYWHSNYSESVPCPHWLIIDMQKELPIAMVRVGRRYYAGNGNNYPTVKVMEVYTSTDNENFTAVGGFTFELPWTAPDGTVVNGNSPKVPGYEDIVFSEIKTARYVKLVITDTNNTNGTCQVSYFKAFEKTF